MHKMFRTKAYEQEYGPHFNEEQARKAVNKMENEDGTRGPHWSIEETTSAIEFYKEEAAKCRRILEQLKDTPITQNKEESTTTTDIIKVS